VQQHEAGLWWLGLCSDGQNMVATRHLCLPVYFMTLLCDEAIAQPCRCAASSASDLQCLGSFRFSVWFFGLWHNDVVAHCDYSATHEHARGVWPMPKTQLRYYYANARWHRGTRVHASCTDAGLCAKLC
jgi:hypothetical protein